MKPKLILTALSIIFFAACSKDKKTDPNKIIGKWQMTHAVTNNILYANNGRDSTVNPETGYDINVQKYNEYFDFEKANCTFSVIFYDGTTNIMQTFQYTLSGNTLKLYDKDGKISFKNVNITGNQMRLTYTIRAGENYRIFEVDDYEIR